MSDRSDEVTESRDARSTDDLLEETENLLEESGSGAGSPAPSRGSADTDRSGASPHSDADAAESSPLESAWGSSSESSDAAGAQPDRDAETEQSGGLRSRLPSLSLGFGLGNRDSSLSPQEYFSPKEFLAVALVLGVGLTAGGLISPFSVAGQLLGLFATAFVVGLITSKRRYLEVGTAGVSVGAVAAFAEYAFFTIIGSASGTTLLAVGAAAGLLAAVVGYYFGRDLRAGLSRDIE